MVGGGVRNQNKMVYFIGNTTNSFLSSAISIFSSYLFIRVFAMTIVGALTVIMLNIVQWNAQSMNAHGFDFYNSMIKTACTEDRPGIICLQETWYDSYNTIHFPNYQLVTKCRKDRHGGLALYIHSSITFRVLNTPEHKEYQLIDIYLQKRVITLVNFYNPCIKITPSLLDEMMVGCKEHIIVCGDCNSHNPLWGSKSLDANGKTVEDFMNKFDLVLLNDCNPTRIDPHRGSLSCLDLTFMSKELVNRTRWSVSKHNFGSDHFVITVDIFSQRHTQNNYNTKTKSNIGLRRSYTNINWELYKMEIDSHFKDLKGNYYKLDIQGKYDLLVGTMLASIDKQAKECKPYTDRSPVPWWNKECSRASIERNTAKNHFMYKTLLYEDLQIYIEKKRVAQAVFRKAKREYWKDYCAKLNRFVDISSVWKRIKGIKQGTKPQIPNLIMDNGKSIAKSAIEKATIFLEIFNSLDSNLSREEVHRRKTSEEEIKKIIRNTGKLNDNALNDDFKIKELEHAISEIKDTAPGKDGIQAKMIRNLPGNFVNFFLELFNEMWDKGSLPGQWTEAIQIPILKKGKDASSPFSYRPVSLTPALCKLMERLVKNRMIWYIEKNDIITPIQSGFMTKRSTTDQIIRLETDIHKGMSNKEYIVIVFLDLEKAYDVVWRQGIVRKMYESGFTGKILNWMYAFLSKRTCQVRVDNHTSEQKECEIGIMQGSVISPLLFNFMINELEKIQDTAEISVYADDICIWFSHRNLSHIKKKLQAALSLVEEWCNNWGMHISSSKSATVVFGRKDKSVIDLKIYDETIPVEKQHKFLGVWFDSRLTWSKHINEIVIKCKKRLNLLKCIAGTEWGKKTDILILVYKGLIRSILDYGCEAYDAASDTLKKKLDSIQYQALKTITGATHLTSLKALQVECNELPLQLRRRMFADKYNFYLRAAKDNHPVKKILLPCWQYERFTWKAGQGPFLKRIRNIECVNIEKQLDCITKKPFWHYRTPQVSTVIKEHVSKKFSSATESKIYANEIISKKWNHFLGIFTDASRLQDGRTGIGFYIPKFNVRKKFKICDINIMRAELAAILMALEWVEEYLPIAIVIFSDSNSALEAIRNVNKSSIIVEIYEKLMAINSFGIEVNFEWVPAHCGLSGNEIADSLAKQASLKNNIDIVVNKSRNEFLSETNEYYKKEWQKSWDTDEKGRHLYYIQRDVKQIFMIRGFNRKEERILHQFRLGKCRLNYYKYLLKKHETGFCNNCNVFETIEHFILSCPKYERQRNRMYRRLNMKNPNLQKLLGIEDNCGKILAFIKGTGRYNEL